MKRKTSKLSFAVLVVYPFLLVFCTCLLFFMSGCFKQSATAEVEEKWDDRDAADFRNVHDPMLIPGTPTVLRSYTEKLGIIPYGNSIYYFPQTEADFGNALSGFLSVATNLEFVGMGPNVVRMNGTTKYGHDSSSNADYGAAVGNWVIFREKR